MSLEAKIAELTLAVQALTHAMQKGQVIETIVASPVVLSPLEVLKENEKYVAAEVTRAEPAAETTSTKAAPSKLPNESSSPASGAQSEPEPQASSLTYDDVKRATNNLSAAKGKEVTIAALARFGVKRATELNESQWREYCNYTVACVAGLDPREAA